MEDIKQNFTLEAWQVEEYLSENPEFFNENSQVLAALNLSHSSGKALSLIERQVQVLRDKNTQLQDQITEFLAAARGNEKINNQVYDFILTLLNSPRNKVQLIQTTETYLRDNLKADYCKILPVKQFELSFLESLLERGLYQGRMNALCKKHLFADNKQAIESVACIKLPVESGDEMLLVLGSTLADKYQENAGTWFLEQLVKVLSSLMANSD